VTALLPTRMVEKPWGRDKLPAPFAVPPGQRIGEIWFEPPSHFARLLVKYIFTSEALSVQVHPSDAQLPGHGKEECWLVVDAQPGAALGIGFRAPLSSGAMRQAALDGSIEHLLEWHPVKPGDFFYIPAGTVHAIGAGVSLIEVQQNSDVTYRLYDYGRPRELHLDAGIAVALGGPHAAEHRKRLPERGNVTLVDGPLFRLDRIDGQIDAATLARYRNGLVLVIPIAGRAVIAGARIAAGECGVAASLADGGVEGPALIAQPCSS
jgi:mannose-6-phosphate isomerase